MKRKIIITLIYLILILLVSCSDHKKISTDDSLPKRIISLGPRITKNLYLLGVQDRLIANTIYCIHPAEAEKKTKIGNLIKMNLEKIFSLRPDIVICTSMSDPEQVKKLETLGIRTFTFKQPKNFKTLCNDFLILGEITGKIEKAKQIINQAEKKLNSIIQSLNSKNRPRVFVQIGNKPLFTATKESFINDLITSAGGINIAGDSATGIYSREKVVQMNPDIIIITSMGLETDLEKKKWLKYKSLNAVKTRRIFSVDQYKMCSPTIVSFADTLKELITILHRGR